MPDSVTPADTILAFSLLQHFPRITFRGMPNNLLSIGTRRTDAPQSPSRQGRRVWFACRVRVVYSIATRGGKQHEAARQITEIQYVRARGGGLQFSADLRFAFLIRSKSLGPSINGNRHRTSSLCSPRRRRSIPFRSLLCADTCWDGCWCRIRCPRS
jgi:hypothetical protein